MTEEQPQLLYRFRNAASPHFRDEMEQLKDNKIWFGFLDTQNDPFEGSVCHRANSYTDFCRRVASLREQLKDRYPDADLLPENVTQADFLTFNIKSPLFHNEVRKQAVVSCFSKLWKNTLMWAHYADQFRGICQIFKPKSAQEDLSAMYEVEYLDDEPPLLLPSDLFIQEHISMNLHRVDGITQRAEIADIAHQKVRRAATTKSSHWSYEEEVRMLSYGGVPGYFRAHGYSLCGIIFGPRAPASVFHNVMSALGDDLEYKKMHLSPNSYSYHLTDVSTPEQTDKGIEAGDFSLINDSADR